MKHPRLLSRGSLLKDQQHALNAIMKFIAHDIGLREGGMAGGFRQPPRPFHGHRLASDSQERLGHLKKVGDRPNGSGNNDVEGSNDLRRERFGAVLDDLDVIQFAQADGFPKEVRPRSSRLD